MANRLQHFLQPMRNFETFRKLLNEQYQWPTVYTFKFIVPKTSAGRLLSVFASNKQVTVRESGKGSYVSVTAQVSVPSSDGVVAVYEAVAEIEGIISL